MTPLLLSTSNAVAGEATVGLAWLVRLRWALVMAQATLLVVATWLLGVPFSPILVGSLVAITAVSNVALAVLAKRAVGATRPLIGSVLVGDTLLLTALLLSSGGPMNPFSVFYIVHVALAALLLDGRWTAGVTALTSLAFGSLFVFTDQASMHAMHHGGGFAAHLRGMWLSYTLASLVVGYFVARVARALAAREREIAALRDVAARNEKLASLSTLAAGAAHELGSPLGTIAVVSKELERMAHEGRTDAAALAEDAALLRSEAERCRRILEKMAGSAGAEMGEAPRAVEIAAILEETTVHIPAERRLRLDAHAGDGEVTVPSKTLGQLLSNLVGNAFDATDEEARVSLRVELDGSDLVCAVEDRGSGMSEEVKRRLGEPFFTTKPPQKGLGLGFFLVRSFAERFRGDLRVESEEGAGTKIVLRVPRRFA